MQGRWSVRKLAEKTGYHYCQLRRALRALGLRPGRTKRARRTTAPFRITEEQRAEILHYLESEPTPEPAVSPGTIAAELGRSPRTAYALARRLGLPHGALTPEDAARLSTALATSQTRTRK